LIVAQRQIAVLKTQRDVANGQLEQARAAKEQADANLARTIIVAPTSGRVTKLTAAKGNYAQIGQALMMFVPRELWVTANFKETQLTDMRPGQRVDIRVDAYPGHPFRGHVDSIQAGSGAAFSLLPPKMRPATTSRSCSVCRSRSSSTKPPASISAPACRSCPT
jgi:membrane fusion protein, multidrug efflux system